MAGRISNENSIEVMTLHSNYLIKYKYLSIWVEDIVRRFVLFTQQLASMSQLTFELWKLVAFWSRHSNILNEIIWCYGSKSHSTYYMKRLLNWFQNRMDRGLISCLISIFWWMSRKIDIELDQLSFSSQFIKTSNKQFT